MINVSKIPIFDARWCSHAKIVKTANLGPKEVDLQTTLLYLYFCKSEIIVWWETIALSQQTAVSDGHPLEILL